jgi:hypothetical protein
MVGQPPLWIRAASLRQEPHFENRGSAKGLPFSGAGGEKGEGAIHLLVLPLPRATQPDLTSCCCVLGLVKILMLARFVACLPAAEVMVAPWLVRAASLSPLIDSVYVRWCSIFFSH